MSITYQIQELTQTTNNYIQKYKAILQFKKIRLSKYNQFDSLILLIVCIHLYNL